VGVTSVYVSIGIDLSHPFTSKLLLPATLPLNPHLISGWKVTVPLYVPACVTLHKTPGLLLYSHTWLIMKSSTCRGRWTYNKLHHGQTWVSLHHPQNCSITAQCHYQEPAASHYLYNIVAEHAGREMPHFISQLSLHQCLYGTPTTGKIYMKCQPISCLSSKIGPLSHKVPDFSGAYPLCQPHVHPNCNVLYSSDPNFAYLEFSKTLCPDFWSEVKSELKPYFFRVSIMCDKVKVWRVQCEQETWREAWVY